MSYKVKDGKTVKHPKTGKPYPKNGEKIAIHYGTDRDLGRWWWVDARYPDEMYGPYANKAEAEADSYKMVFGEQCEIKDGGVWDPAWDRLQ
jgi:hypothetical protein